MWRFTFDKPGGDWFRTDFNDAPWQEAPGGFGEYGTPNSVIGTLWKSSDIWLRRTFTLPDKPAANPRLVVYHDDDAEVYLNGVLAATMTGYVAGYVAVDISPAAKAGLKSGKNVIAVHCHQVGGGQFIDVGIEETPTAAGGAP